MLFVFSLFFDRKIYGVWFIFISRYGRDNLKIEVIRVLKSYLVM